MLASVISPAKLAPVIATTIFTPVISPAMLAPVRSHMLLPISMSFVTAGSVGPKKYGRSPTKVRLCAVAPGLWRVLEGWRLGVLASAAVLLEPPLPLLLPA